MAARQSGQPTTLGRSPLSLRLWRNARSRNLTATPGCTRSRRALGGGRGGRIGESDDQRCYQHQPSNPASRCVALHCAASQPPVPNDSDSAVGGDPASCANRCRACEHAATRATASTSPATGLPSPSGHQGTQSDPARLWLADSSPMVCAAAGIASRGIVCVDGNRRLDWAGVYCGIANKGGTSPQWIRSRDGMDGALKLAKQA